jgi:hypothetical protein
MDLNNSSLCSDTDAQLETESHWLESQSSLQNFKYKFSSEIRHETNSIFRKSLLFYICYCKIYRSCGKCILLVVF